MAELVYPFIVCQSNGGEYEDQSFVAGAQFGHIEALMEENNPTIDRYVHSGIVSQLDLAAMYHGYLMEEIVPWEDDPDSWTWVKLIRQQTIVKEDS